MYTDACVCRQASCTSGIEQVFVRRNVSSPRLETVQMWSRRVLAGATMHEWV